MFSGKFLHLTTIRDLWLDVVLDVAPDQLRSILSAIVTPYTQPARAVCRQDTSIIAPSDCRIEWDWRARARDWPPVRPGRSPKPSGSVGPPHQWQRQLHRLLFRHSRKAVRGGATGFSTFAI
jgi:hypothetical protein